MSALNNILFIKLYRMTVSLAYVPPHDVVYVFTGVIGPMVDALGDMGEISAAAVSWFDYFERTYIGQEKSYRSVLSECMFLHTLYDTDLMWNYLLIVICVKLSLQ